MKKIITLFGIALLLGNFAFADETLTQPIEGSVVKTKLTVFSDEDNNFGLKDSAGNVIVEPEYKKMIKLGDSWIIQKKQGHTRRYLSCFGDYTHHLMETITLIIFAQNQRKVKF